MSVLVTFCPIKLFSFILNL